MMGCEDFAGSIEMTCLNFEENRAMYWRRFNGDAIQKPIYEAVEEILQREHTEVKKLKVCIGSDSQVRGRITEFATVIVFLREKNGGFMFIRNEKTSAHLTLKERLLSEVSKSVEIAYKLCPLFDQYDIDMEVHADINTNPHFQSNAALKEAMGFILGMGFAFKAKPEAFASSSCANKVV